MSVKLLPFLDDPVGEGPILWTPEMAQYALENHNKRPLQRKIINRSTDQYTHTMADGLWIENWYQTWIAFEEGTRFIQNGQHTLSAIVASEQCIVIRTAWNVPSDRMQYWDGFKARTLSLAVSQANMNNVVQRNAFTRMVMWLEEGRPVYVSPTLQDVRRVTLDDETADRLITYVRSSQDVKQLRNLTSVIYALWKISKANDVETAMRFYNSVASGINLTESDPRLHLARFLRNQQGVSNTADMRLAVSVGIVKAFNAWATNKPMALLRVNRDEPMPEPIRVFITPAHTPRVAAKVRTS